jgi:conjugal transfer pilus assembly protein TraU
MLKNFLSISLILLSFGADSSTSAAADMCPGKFPNPISDICWYCIFPINIGGIIDIDPTPRLNLNDDPGLDPPLMCVCPAPPPVFYRIGVGISYWEPARISEVVRRPGCSPFLDGQVLFDFPNANWGGNEEAEDEHGIGSYQVHYLQYPLLTWVGQAVTQGMCDVEDTSDYLYFSELDATWDDDEASFIFGAESVLFANPIAQLACVADSTVAAVRNFGIDELFWCSGSQGSVFPLSGNQDNHIGGIDTSLVMTHRMIYKLHRMGLAQDTSTPAAICGNVAQPVMRKGQYKSNMMYPFPFNLQCWGFGVPSALWIAGREFPVTGEDFMHLVWRKRLCCAF